MEGKDILKIVINVIVNIVLLLIYLYFFGVESMTKYLQGDVTIVGHEKELLSINPPGIIFIVCKLNMAKAFRKSYLHFL